MLTDVLDRFLEQAKIQPKHPAVVSGNDVVTYSELNSLTRRIAAEISLKGEAQRVLIYLPQGHQAYSSMLGTLLAGGYYSPANISAPSKLQEHIFRRFEPDLVVTSAQYSEGLEVYINKDSIIEVENVSPEELSESKSSHEIAYVIFTSGSTGEPKGVSIGRDGLNNYISWSTDAMRVTHQDRWSQHPNIAFDLSVLDIYGALCAGATLYPISNSRDRLMPAEAIKNNKLTIWNSVPSVIDLMQRANQMTKEHLSSLRLMTFCGEPLYKEHLDSIFSAKPQMIVHNTYGPTEATVSCTILELRDDNYLSACGDSVALGESIPNMNLNLVGGESDDEGEIVLSGPQLAIGYWKDTVSTHSVFEYMEVDGTKKRIYRTGDWAKREGSHLFFQSRVDRQIKIRGHRIELGQIDAALRDCGAKTVCTIFSKGKLFSFIENNTELYSKEKDLVEIRKCLSQHLPKFAIPEKIFVVDQLPRNANDKIDTTVLSENLK